MKKYMFSIISLALVLAVTSWSPGLVTPSRAAELSSTAAASSPITLTITNPLPKATTVTLSGDRSYTINVPQGATITSTIEAGKYKFSYQGCLNKAKKGNLKVKGAAAALKIAPCKMATWVWYNEDDSQTATIRLKGWMSYTVTVGPGQILSFSWVADKYQGSLTACGKTFDGTWKVKGKKSWIIYACK